MEGEGGKGRSLRGQSSEEVCFGEKVPVFNRSIPVQFIRPIDDWLTNVLTSSLTSAAARV